MLTYNRNLFLWFKNLKFLYVKLQLIEPNNESSMIEVAIEASDKLNVKMPNYEHWLILRASKVKLDEIEQLRLLLSKKNHLDLEILINVSGIISNSLEASHERVTLEKFRALGKKVRFLAWDQRVLNNSEFSDFRFLPEAKIQHHRSVTSEKNVVGFYGKLSFQRGLFDLLLTVYLNPKLNYRIVGYDFNPKYLYRRKGFVSIRKTPLKALSSLILNSLARIALKSKRVNFREMYFQDEIEMSRDMQACSAIFFSCNRTPYSSGLVYQSLASEVPVVWVDGKSAMSFVLDQHFPLGRLRPEFILRYNYLTSKIESIKNEKTKIIFSLNDFDSVMKQCHCKL